MTIFILGIIIFPTLSSLANPLAVEFIVNGGFETGDTSSWVLYPGATGNVQTDVVYTGTYAVELSTTSNGAYIGTYADEGQTITPSTIYYVGGYIYDNDPNGYIRVGVTALDGYVTKDVGSFDISGDSAEWRPFEYSITTTDTTDDVFITFSLHDTTSTAIVYLDGLSFNDEAQIGEFQGLPLLVLFGSMIFVSYLITKNRK